MLTKHSLSDSLALTVNSSDNSPSSFLFNGLAHQLSHSVKHLGHILTSDLSDSEDIERVWKDFIRKANCMLHSFASCIILRLNSFEFLALTLWLLKPEL